MALTLTRTPGQTILVNDDIRVTVVDVRGDKVRLRVEAPAEKKILREELTKQDRPSGSD